MKSGGPFMTANFRGRDRDCVEMIEILEQKASSDFS